MWKTIFIQSFSIIDPVSRSLISNLIVNFFRFEMNFLSKLRINLCRVLCSFFIPISTLMAPNATLSVIAPCGAKEFLSCPSQS